MENLKLCLGSKMIQNKRKLEWIWPGRIPRAYISILAAEGGIGKTGLALCLADRFAGDGKTVVFVDAESCTSHLNERMQTWNLPNAGKIYFYGKYLQNGDFSTGAGGTILDLVDNIASVKPDLVILDSLTALSTDYDINKSSNIAGFYQAMAQLTDVGNAAVLIIAHLRKPMNNEESILRNSNISGSAAIVNLARSVMMMKRHSVNDDTIILTHTKCNMAKLANDLIIKVDPKTGEFYNFREEKPRIKITTGIKMDQIRIRGMQLVEDGLTKREIAKQLKEDLSASMTEITRFWKWLLKNKNISLDIQKGES